MRKVGEVGLTGFVYKNLRCSLSWKTINKRWPFDQNHVLIERL